MTVILDSRADFTLEAVRRVAWQGEAVALGERAIAAIAEGRRGFMALLESEPGLVIYSVTTGFGDAAGTPLDAAGRRRQAQRPAYHRGIGSGEPMPERVVRGILFARLANFVEGQAAVSPAVAAAVAAMLDGRPVPALPWQGQMSSGEVDQLTALFRPLIGAACDEKDHGILVNGAPASAALAADAALRAARRLDLVERVFALSIEALGAPLEAYDPALAPLWCDPHQARALQNLDRLLAGASRAGRRAFQAPVSWRIVPRVLGNAHRLAAGLAQVAETSLRSVTDNPVYLAPDAAHPRGRVISNGGFHDACAYPAINALAAAWADLATLCGRHVAKLNRGDVTGLPAGLARPGGSFGTQRLCGAQLWFEEKARGLAQPTLLPGGDGGATQSDVFLPTFLAAERETGAGECLDASLALLAVIASQALWLAEREPAPTLAGFLAAIRRHVPPVESLRDLGAETGGLGAAFTRATTGLLAPAEALG